MSGYPASADGTRRFAQRAIDEGIPDSAYRALGRTGLVTSSLGFGSYRIDAHTPEHAAALEKALFGGVNLIDTSTNYADGSSETCIGNVLVHYRRDELIIVSKAGYVQGQALTMARAGRSRLPGDLIDSAEPAHHRQRFSDFELQMFVSLAQALLNP